MMTPLEVLIAEKCRRSFWCFVKEFWSEIPGAGTLIPSWHMEFLCNELQFSAERVMAGLPRLYDLVINVPFGTSKSSIISILLQPWVWTRSPSSRFLCGTHTDRLVTKFGSKIRSVLLSEKYQRWFTDIKLKRDADEWFSNTKGGDRVACTVGGKTPMGEHASFLIVDDPCDPEGVRSEAELETAARFMTEVLPGRLTDKEVSVTILVMQRLDPRDPTHVMLEFAKREGAFPVKHICLPGELTDDVRPRLDDIRTMFPGAYGEDGLLDPVRLNRLVLNNYRARGQFFYSAQVLQNPVPRGGGRFEPAWFGQTVRAAPYDSSRVRAWDRAATHQGGCYTAGTLMARDRQGRLYVEDVVHGQWEPNQRNDIMVATAKRDRIRYGPKHEPTIVIEAERGSTGRESFQHISRRLLGFRIRESKPSGNKDARAEPWADQLAAGNVWLVSNGQWDVDGFIREHLMFRPDLTSKRLGGLKDRVDSASHAANWLSNQLPAGKFTVMPFRRKGSRAYARKLVSCPPELLETLIVEDNPTLLISFAAPQEAGGEAGEPTISWGAAAAKEFTAGPLSDVPVRHGLMKCLGALSVACADIAPGEHQEDWEVPLEGYDGMLPRDVILNRDQCKKLWAFLTKKRDPAWEVAVFTGPGGLPLSAARAVSFGLGLREAEAVYDAATGGEGAVKMLEGPPPNKHVYDLIKSTRAMVV